MSLDFGGNLGSYIGDLCRMATLGEPDAELEDLLGEIDVIQMAARRNIDAGVRGGDILAVPEALEERSPHRSILDFVAHGMGIVSHEASWLPGSLRATPCPMTPITRTVRCKPASCCRLKQQCRIRCAASPSWKTGSRSRRVVGGLSATRTVAGIWGAFEIVGRRHAGPSRLKMIVVDICLGEDQWWPKQDLVLGGEL